MTTTSRKYRQKAARRVAVTITALLVAGSTLDRALADTNHKPASATSREETTGAVSGLAIGAAAGGPFGAILGAAGGAWLGDRWHRDRAVQRRLVGEQGRLVGELARANDALAALEANSLPLDELNARVHFRTADAVLQVEDDVALRQLGASLAARTRRPIHVTGFADARGASGFNFELSTARAEAVAEALVAGGLPRAQIKVLGAGAPLHSECLSDADRCAFERRVTVRLAEPAVAQVQP